MLQHIESQTITVSNQFGVWLSPEFVSPFPASVEMILARKTRPCIAKFVSICTSVKESADEPCEELIIPPTSILPIWPHLDALHFAFEVGGYAVIEQGVQE